MLDLLDLGASPWRAGLSRPRILLFLQVLGAGNMFQDAPLGRLVPIPCRVPAFLVGVVLGRFVD